MSKVVTMEGKEIDLEDVVTDPNNIDYIDNDVVDLTKSISPLEDITNDLDKQPEDSAVDRFFRDIFTDKIEVKIKPLVSLNEFTIPYKGSEGAACFDVKAVSVNMENELFEVGLGFCTEIPLGYKGVIVPRSSFTKTEWVMQNSPAQIDADYRGEWIIKFRYVGNKTSPIFPILKGERVAQIYFEKVEPVNFTIVDELTNTKRNDGGFGSTGK